MATHGHLREAAAGDGWARPPSNPPAHGLGSAPDWDRVGPEVSCPLCRYNLRGLVEPRCPECGYRFEWPDLLDPARRRHPFLFEHHPEHSDWSFWKTAIGGVRTRHFWASISPAQYPDVRRLTIYWLLAAAISFLGAASPYAARLAAEHDWYGFIHGSIWPRAVEEIGPAYVTSWILVTVWPWLCYATLMLFQASMRRAKVDASHVWRCIVYSTDTALWAGLGLLLWSALAVALQLPPKGVGGFIEPAAVLFVAAAYVVMVWRLAVAYRYYLQFKHAGWTVVASQVIVGLVVLNIYVGCTLGGFGSRT